MKLYQLKRGEGSRRKKKRVGRGPGSGHGLRSGRGNKGQKARSGGGVRLGFEGGQMPLTRRLPKRGFKNALFKKRYAVVNLYSLEEQFETGTEITPQILRQRSLVKKNLPIKVLGKGEISKSLQIKVDAFSESARKKIEAAGGHIQNLQSSS